MVPASILRLLNRLRWRDRWLGLARGLGWGVALVIAVVVFACFVDWLVDLFVDTPGWLRIGLSLLPLLAIGGALSLAVAPLLKRLRDDDLALWIERRVPLGQRLIAAVQLNRETADVRGMSPALIAAVTRRAEREAEDVELSRVCDNSRLKRGLYAAMPALLGLMLLLLLAPATMGALFARLLGKDVEIPRSVYFQPTGRDVWPANEEGVVRIRVTRGKPGERTTGTALIRPKTGRSFSVPLRYESEDDGGVVYSGKVPPSDVPFTYLAWLSDGRLRRPAAITYAPRPVATSVRSWIELPTRIAKRQDNTPYHEPMKGGDLFYRVPDAKGIVLVTAQVPLNEAWLEVIDTENQSRRVPMTVETDEEGAAKMATGSFAFQKDDSAYEVHMIDRNGFECVDRPRRLIRRMPLLPPEVTLLPETLYREGDSGSPDEREIEGVPILRTDNPDQGRRFNFKYRCEARYGVQRAQLRYRLIRAGKEADDSGKIERDDFLTLPLGGGPPTPKAREEFSTLPPAHADAIPDVEGKGGYDFHIDGIPDLIKGGEVEVKEGDRIQFYVEVFGKADPKANPGRSAIREKEVVSLEEFRKWISAKDDLKERTRLLEEQQRGVKVGD